MFKKYHFILLFIFVIGLTWLAVSDVLIIEVSNKLQPASLKVLRIGNDATWLSLTIYILYRQMRKQQQALNRSEEQYRKLFAAHPTPMWVYHTENLNFLAVNDAAIAQYGYSAKEFYSMSIKQIRPANEVKLLEEIVKVNQMGLRNLGVWHHMRKNGEIFPVSIVSHGVNFNGLPGKLVQATNITDIIQKEIKLQEAYQHEKELKEQLSGQYDLLLVQHKIFHEIAWSNSHELRPPVCSIIGLTEVLKDAETEDERQHCINLILKTGQELDNIIKRTDEKISRMEPLKPNS
ncbi:PAS domain S-box protein [Mucilaginibacter litoreus]|uniref:histidine kinase n=1 Tax=Mucilaginibacter litoreus TaxID=1048221 RepID=A0ABW3AS35_9SPHI